MKKLIGLTLVIILLPLVSCAPSVTEPEVEQEDTQMTEIEKALAERGALNADTVEEASKIAGYPVTAPAFLPEGFHRSGKIMVSQLGVPGFSDAAEFPKHVEQIWTWEEDREVWFMLTQSPKQFGVGGAEPSEVCGRTGERKLSEAGPDTPARLTLGWSDGSLFYSLSGTLAEPLTEEVLLKIVCSVGVE
ncbi:hypothetical protein ACFLXK_01830 [Chloroflexota bacterium]